MEDEINLLETIFPPVKSQSSATLVSDAMLNKYSLLSIITKIFLAS